MKCLVIWLLIARSLFAIDIAPQLRLNYAVGKTAGIANNYEGLSVVYPWAFAKTHFYGLFNGDFTYLNKSSNFAVGNAVTAELGTRYITRHHTAVYGLQTYFDYRRTFAHAFYQSGFSFARMGPRWDTRANFFFPIGKRCRILESFPADYNGGYVLRFAEELWAIRGIELGMGKKIPLSTNLLFNPSASAYHMVNNNPFWGYRIHFLLQYQNLWKVNLNITRDREFDTRVQGLFEVSFSAIGRLPYTFVRQALNNPIERFRMILLDHFEWWQWNW